MKFNHGLENYKKDQQRMDTVSLVKPEVHYSINDGARCIIEGIEFREYDKNVLEAVWDELQSLDRDIVSLLENYRTREIISNESTLVIVSFFLSTLQIGPDSTDIRDRFYQRLDTEESFRTALFNVSIPEHTREVLSDTYRRIIASF